MTDAPDTPAAEAGSGDDAGSDTGSADGAVGAEAAAGAESADDIGYTAALAELADILHELDVDEVDVDVLGGRVRRAAELLRICRGRIASARFEVEQVVAELDPTAGQLSGELDDA